MTHILEVRCCCHPGKLLGLMKVNVEPFRGMIIRFARLEKPDINMQVAEISINGRRYLALKDSGYCIEDLRGFPGFVETPSKVEV